MYDQSYAIHKTTVYLDPTDYNGGLISTEVTWDIMPKYRIDDYISISWDGAVVKGKTSTFRGTSKVFYDYKQMEKGCFGFCVNTIEEGSDYETDYFDSSKISQEYHGAIMKVNLQDDYDMRDSHYGLPPMEPRYNKSGDMFEVLEVTKMVITLQAEFDLDGSYSSFKDTGYL